MAAEQNLFSLVFSDFLCSSLLVPKQHAFAEPELIVGFMCYSSTTGLIRQVTRSFSNTLGRNVSKPIGLYDETFSGFPDLVIRTS